MPVIQFVEPHVPELARAAQERVEQDVPPAKAAAVVVAMLPVEQDVVQDAQVALVVAAQAVQAVVMDVQVVVAQAVQAVALVVPMAVV